MDTTALIAAIGFGIALLFSLTRFYVPIIPLILAIVSFVKTKDIIPSAVIPEMEKPLGSAQAADKTDKAVQAVQEPAASIIPADELKKLKELLDSGILTQEEFEAKKKQLLGL